MILRWVALQLYLTPTQPCRGLASRMVGSATARYGFRNCAGGIPVTCDQKLTEGG